MAKIYSFLILAFVVFLAAPVTVSAATLSISPTSGTYEAGDRITAKVIVSSSVPLNAVSGTVTVSPSMFAIESVLKTGSVLNFWVTEPAVSSAAGTARFEGVALNGFQGNGGVVVTLILRALKAGPGSVTIQSGQVLANDGQGTDITSGVAGAQFVVEEARPKPKPEVPATVKKPEPGSDSKAGAEKPVVTEKPQPTATLEAPEIMLSSKYGEEAISGSSDYPRTEVLLTFVSESGSKVFITGSSDGDGEFTLLVPNSLKYGAYKVSAIMIKKDGTHSNPSEEILVGIGNPISDIGREAWIAIGLLIGAIIYLLVRAIPHYRRTRAIRASIKHEVTEAEALLHKSFDLLREDVESHSQGKTSAAERERLASLKKDLTDAEEVLDKEIRDIDKHIKT